MSRAALAALQAAKAAYRHPWASVVVTTRLLHERPLDPTTNQMLANRSHISEKTVKILRGRFRGKMHPASLAELVLLAQRAGVHTTKGLSE